MANDLTQVQEFKWLAEMSIDAGDFDDAGAGGRGELADQLSIKDNVFTFKTSEGTTDAPNPRQLYFVYLGGKKPKSRSLYQGAFNDDDLQAPVCTSVDGVSFEEGSQPPVITDPQHPRCGQETRNCRECPMAKWGSAISVKTGKAVPACKEHKDIAIKVMGVPGAWLFKLPPASFTNWDKATAKLKVAIAADKAAHDGETTLSLGNAVFSASFGPGMGNIIFEPVGYLAKIPEEMSQVVAIRREPEVIDKLLWGSVERRLQYEEGKAYGARGTPAQQEANKALGREIGEAINAVAGEPPLEYNAVPPAALAAKNTAKLQQAQATLREAAQAASAALEAKQGQQAEPLAEPAKKATKPSPYKDVGAILKGMGLPG
jgi:hypothetical protein